MDIQFSLGDGNLSNIGKSLLGELVTAPPVIKFSVPVSSGGYMGEKGSNEYLMYKRLQKRLLPSPGASENTATVDYLHFEMKPNRSKDTVRLGIMSGSVTQALTEVFGSNVAIKVVIANLHCRDFKVVQVGSFTSEEIKLGNDSDYAGEDAYFLKGEKPQGFNCRHLFYDNVSAQVKVLVKVDLASCVSAPVITDKMAVFRKMHTEKIHCDLTIIPRSGEQVKAHKSVLVAHSPVFDAMFRSDMTESRTSTVQLSDMSEDSVNGLLEYLYCWEETEAKAKPEVAFEMLQAAHKYDIPVLEGAMKKVLLGQANILFNEDVALRPFFFALKLDNDDGQFLKNKAVEILKRTFGSSKKSPTCINLFREDPEAGVKLCELAFAKLL